MKTSQERKKYREGFHTGLHWPDKWDNHGKPGGPWVRSKDEQSHNENIAWKCGWNDGFELKKATGRSNTVIPIPDFKE